MKQINIADMDVIFLTYDEPLREESWIKLRNLVPWAKRVDGVKGSDAAHKAAAAASTTERFILIDGDNIPDPTFFDLGMQFPNERWEQATYRWRSQNGVNGLIYGNGGISSWTKAFVNEMRTHEATDGRPETEVEFCFDPLYWSMHDCYSVTYPNGSPFQAWRAGFREGVKMCLNRGVKPAVSDFATNTHPVNIERLNIWHNIGRDALNGIWCIAGSRMGTYMTMLTPWDYKQVQDFDVLADLWETIKTSDPELLAGRIAEDLNEQLNLPIANFGINESYFFKYHYNSLWKNRGIMVRELDVND